MDLVRSTPSLLVHCARSTLQPAAAQLRTVISFFAQTIRLPTPKMHAAPMEEGDTFTTLACHAIHLPCPSASLPFVSLPASPPPNETSRSLPSPTTTHGNNAVVRQCFISQVPFPPSLLPSFHPSMHALLHKHRLPWRTTPQSTALCTGFGGPAWDPRGPERNE